MSFKDLWIRDIFLAESKIFSLAPKPVAIISTRTVLNLKYVDNTVFNLNTSSQDDTSSDELNLCRVARQVTIPARTQAAVLVSCKGAGPMIIETHDNVIGRWYCITAKSEMAILRGKPFYICIANMTAKPGNLSKFITLVYCSSAPTCIIQGREDEPHMLEERGLMSMQNDKCNSEHTANAIRYKLAERSTEQKNRHNAEKYPTKLWRPIGARISPYQTSIRQIATNLWTWVHRSKACGTYTLIRLRHCRTESSWKRQITDQFTLSKTTQGLMRGNLKCRK